MQFSSPVDILLIEDSPSDQLIAKSALAKAKLANTVTVIEDGVAALAYLRREGHYSNAIRPDLILLDLNLPKKDGREVLVEIKRDPSLRSIPVVILTTSQAEEDVARAYSEHANCYVSKPVDFERFQTVVQAIQEFWFQIVKLPPKSPP